MDLKTIIENEKTGKQCKEKSSFEKLLKLYSSNLMFRAIDNILLKG